MPSSFPSTSTFDLQAGPSPKRTHRKSALGWGAELPNRSHQLAIIVHDQAPSGLLKLSQYS